MPETTVCAPAVAAYSIVPPHVLPAGMGVTLVAEGTDVLMVPVLLMVPNVPLNTVVVPKLRSAPAPVVNVPFTTKPVIPVEEVTVEDAATARLLKVLLTVVPLITLVPLKFTVPLLWVNVALLEKLPDKFIVPEVEVSVPALMVKLPAVIACPLLSAHVPALALVIPPVPILMILDIVLPLAAPPRVRSKPDPVIVPVLLNAIVPVPATILLALSRVTKPETVAAVGLLLINAPPEAIPVPLRYRFLAQVNPFKSNTAPLAIRV